MSSSMIKIVPNTRIEALHSFYNNITTSAELCEDEYFGATGKGLTEDAKGMQLLAQVQAGAKRIFVLPFILAHEDGGIDLPEIEPRQNYVTAHLEEHKERLDHLRSGIDVQVKNCNQQLRMYEDACAVVDELENEQAGLEQPPAPCDNATEEQKTAYAAEETAFFAEAERLEQQLERAVAHRENRVAAWSGYCSTLDKDRQRIQDILSKAVKEGTEQHSKDTEALDRAIDALAKVRTFVSSILRKLNTPVLYEVVSAMGEESVDPYQEADMRAVFANLKEAYRNSSELNICTAIINGMKLEQAASQPLRAFFRLAGEEFCQRMYRMKVHTIRVSDLGAMIVIGGMSKKLQEEFLRSESQLSLTLESLAELPDETDDGSSVATTRRAAPKTLMGKVRVFVKKHAELEVISTRLRGTSLKDASGSGQHQPVTTIREAQKRAKEAQQVLAALEVGKELCLQFQRTGHCKFGVRCKYLHPVVKSQGQCFSWRDTGACPNGDACRFADSHVAKKKDEAKKQSAPASGAVTKQPAAARQVTKATPGASKAVSTLFTTTGEERWNSEFEEEDQYEQDDCGCVQVREVPAAEDTHAQDVCLSAKTVVGKLISERLHWDSGSSISVASRRAIMDGGGVPVKTAREAVGVGGARPITHRGVSSIFEGLDMHYIKGGGTPNLLSIGRSLQPNSEGTPGLALFSDIGAVRFRAPPHIEARFRELVSEVERLGLIEGTAVQKNFVYTEQFGNGEPPAVASATESELSCPVTVKMFAGRIHLDDAENAIAFLSTAGLSQAALIAGAENNTILGLPPAITAERVKQYFKYIGKEPEQLMADIVSAPLRTPLGYQHDVVAGAGSVLQMDNVDPSFSRLKQSSDLDEEDIAAISKGKASKKVVLSIGGYKDAVIGVDVATGFAFLEGRETKKHPHLVVKSFVKRWVRRWNCFQLLKADKEFVTPESIAIVEELGGKVRQSVPGDHRRNTGMVEGAIRWIQDLAQANMNQLQPLVKKRVITEEVARSLWFHALRHAVWAYNLRPSLRDASKTRFEEGYGEVASLARTVMMPFGMSLVGKKLRNDSDGRGVLCLYVGPSATVPGGVITLSLESGRLSCKYSFLPVVDVVKTGQAKARATAAKAQYGRVVAALPPVPSVFGDGEVHEEGAHSASQLSSAVPMSPSGEAVSSSAPVVSGGSEGVLPSEVADSSPLGAATESGGESQQHTTDSSASEVPAVSPELTGPAVVFDASDPEVPPVYIVPQRKSPAVISDYNTRRRKVVEKAVNLALEQLDVEAQVYALDERPLMPKVPSNKECATNRRWIEADLREAAKLNVEETFLPLPCDEAGVSYRPDNAIVLTLLRVREFKWKPDPDTGVMCWLECCRFVCDGSRDHRAVSFYAECPDRMLLFLMISIGATLGETSGQSDCERAYLNALSIDRNIVILAAGIRGVPRESLLNKGLYGSKGGALSWERWINEKMDGFGYTRAQVARGVYLKRLASGELIRALRHSDDFRTSSCDAEAMVEEHLLMRSGVRMSEFVSCERFLGCTMERIDAETGLPNVLGTVVLVRQCEKIAEMGEKFAQWIPVMNPKHKVRRSPLPSMAVMSDGELQEMEARLLLVKEIKEYMSLIGYIGWIAGSTRPDCKFAYFLLATRMSAPRMWDMFLAVYCMEYLLGTLRAPLVLGGPICDPEVHADASFAILDERRSVVGHLVTTGPGSGAVYAHVGATKCAVSSIWEAELIAGCDGVDSALYMTQVCNELEYPTAQCRSVWVDNKAEIDWIRGSVSNKRSRHIDVKMYRTRHMDEKGLVKVQHKAGSDNPADILTKPLVGPVFVKHATTTLGHELVRGLGIDGAFC